MRGVDVTLNFHYDDFTESHYLSVLQVAKRSYSFEPFGTRLRHPHVLWRHDIDLSVHRAARLAQIEADLGVSSTYFFLLHCEFYNMLERTVVQLARGISDLGHWSGLHFDLGFYGSSLGNDELVEALAKERRLLEDILESPVGVFSFHNPHWGNALDVHSNSIAGMINTYGQETRERYRYLSDSDGYWRFDRLFTVLEDERPERLHVLTHPEWWQEQALTPRERVARCIEGRARRVFESYDARMAMMGRINLGAPEPVKGPDSPGEGGEVVGVPGRSE